MEQAVNVIARGKSVRMHDGGVNGVQSGPGKGKGASKMTKHVN